VHALLFGRLLSASGCPARQVRSDVKFVGISPASQVYENIDEIVFVSKRNLESFERQLLVSNGDNSHIIYNSFVCPSLSRNLKPSNNVRFALVARLEVSQKGHHF